MKKVILTVATSLLLAVTPAWASGSLGVMTLNLDPSSGQVGTPVTVSGKNAPQTSLQVWIAPESDLKNGFQLTASVQPNQDGTWQTRVDIPGEWPKYVVVPGRYLVTVQAPDKSYVEQGEFTVLSAEGTSPSPTAVPAGSGFMQALGRNSLLPIVGLLVILGALGWAVNRFGKQS